MPSKFVVVKNTFFSGAFQSRSLSLALLLFIYGAMTPTATALEVLPVKELAEHCALLESQPDGVDGQYCIRYIQGFIDGAIATDARVMLNAAQESAEGETFLERAMRTRLPGRLDREKAARLAGFCLGDPLPLLAIVNVVVAELAAIEDEAAQNEPAMEAVYGALVKHYPCAA